MEENEEPIEEVNVEFEAEEEPEEEIIEEKPKKKSIFIEPVWIDP